MEEKDKTLDQMYLDKLLKERDDLDTLIEFVQRRIGSNGVGPTPEPERESPHSSPNRFTRGTPTIEQDTFFGLSIVDAAKKYLGMVGKPARSSNDILGALNRGGFPDLAYNTMASVLSRADHNQQGICRIGRGTWGLSEWYPSTGRRMLRPVEPPEETSGEEKDE